MQQKSDKWRLQNLAQLRGQSIKETLKAIGELRLKDIPIKIPKAFLDVRALELAESGIEDDLPFIKMPGGRIYFGLPQPPRIDRLYSCLHDQLPHNLNPKCFLLAHNIVFRLKEVWTSKLIGDSAQVVMEVGAYHGLKALRFFDELGASGRVFAIEMMPENTHVLKRNIEVNNLNHSVIPICAGVWNSNKKQMVASNGYQKNAILPIDGRDWSNEKTIEVDLLRLDTLINTHNIKSVDLLNMQVNGAEVEAIKGLASEIHRVKLLNIVAPYKRDGESLLDKVESTLIDLDCELLLKTSRGIVASPKCHVNNYKWVQNLTTPFDQIEMKEK